MKQLSKRGIVKKISKKLGIDTPIQIIESYEANAWTKDGIIYITSSAISEFSIDEIAFILAHEDAHILSKHQDKSTRVIDVIKGEMSQIVRSKKSVGKKTLELLGLGIVGGTGLTLVNHMNEIEADVKAKKNLKKAGFDEKAGEKFLKKTKHSVSFSHPASNLRNDILKSLK